jgi:uncharacterized membrane protein YphA (DoxX/SURF4 family)
MVMTWVFVIVIAVVMIPAGASKLTGKSATRWSERFLKWGYPDKTAIVVGIAELACGIGLLMSRTRMAAAIGVIVLMTGALGTHLLNGEVRRIIPPLVLGGAAAAVVVLARRRSLAANLSG